MILITTVTVKILCIFDPVTLTHFVCYPYTPSSWDHTENEDKHLISQVASMHPLELNNSDLDISKNHISNVSNIMVNVNENRVSALSISYIEYFYHVFPLHVNSFNSLFSDVISPKLSILISSVNQFTCLTSDIDSFICSLKAVSSYLENYNPAESLLNIIKAFDGDSYVEPVKTHINKMIGELEGKLNYEQIINHIYSIVETYNESLKRSYDNFKNKVKKHQSSLEGNIKEYIGKIKQDLTNLCCCADQLIKLISKAIQTLETNKSNLGQFSKYTHKIKLLDLSKKNTSNQCQSLVTLQQMIKLEIIFDTHKKYKEYLDSCSQITAKLKELNQHLESLKNCSKELTKKLEPLTSGELSTTNIYDVEKSLKEFKTRHVDNFDKYENYVEKLQEIGQLITTMKTTLEQVDPKTKTKLMDKVVKEAADHITGLKDITIEKSKVHAEIEKIKKMSKLVIAKLQFAKSGIKFHESLKKELSELEKLNGVTFKGYEFTDYSKNSTEINQKLDNFKKTIESELSSTKEEIKKSEEEIKELKDKCPEILKQTNGNEDESILCKLKELLTKDYTEDIPNIKNFIEKSSQEIEIIKNMLTALENRKKQSLSYLIHIKCMVSYINELKSSTKTLIQIRDYLNKFAGFQENTKFLIDQFSSHTKVKSIQNFSESLQDSIFTSSKLIAYHNYYIDYLDTIKYLDSITNDIKLQEEKLIKIKNIIENFKKYINDITTKLDTINCDLCQLKGTISACCPGYNNNSCNVPNSCNTKTQVSGTYDLCKMKDYINNLKLYLGLIKIDLTNTRMILYRIKQDSTFIYDFQPYLNYFISYIQCSLTNNNNNVIKKGFLDYLKSIKNRINQILTIKILIDNFKGLKCIENIESKLTLVERSISDLECAIEAVVKNMIRCSLKSLSNHPANSCITRGGVINENDQLVINFSILNVTKYNVVINRLLYTSEKMDQIFKLISWLEGCKCIQSLESATDNSIHLNFYFVKNIIEKLISDNKDQNVKSNLRFDKIRKMNRFDTGSNHLCLCMIIKYITYPTMINVMYITMIDMEMLSTTSRKFDKYLNYTCSKFHMMKVFILFINLLYKVSIFIDRRYLWATTTIKVIDNLSCSCRAAYDKYYQYLVSTMLYVSSLIDNIWTMNRDTVGNAIECLSSLIREFDNISQDTTNSIEKNKCKLVIYQIMFNKCSCTTSDSQCDPKCCCIKFLIIILDVYLCISFKIISKLYKGKCDTLKESLCGFLKLLCKCNGDCCITKLLGTCEQICSNNRNCQELFNSLKEVCTNIKCCTGECPCENIKKSCENLCESLKNEVEKLIQCIDKCCKNDKCKCKIMSVIKLMTKIMIFIQYKIMNEVKMNSLRLGSLTWRALSNNIKILYLCYNKVMISMTKNNYSNHFNTYTDHKNIANSFPSLTMGYGYDTVY